MRTHFQSIHLTCLKTFYNNNIKEFNFNQIVVTLFNCEQSIAGNQQALDSPVLLKWAVQWVSEDHEDVIVTLKVMGYLEFIKCFKLLQFNCTVQAQVSNETAGIQTHA